MTQKIKISSPDKNVSTEHVSSTGYSMHLHGSDSVEQFIIDNPNKNPTKIKIEHPNVNSSLFRFIVLRTNLSEAKVPFFMKVIKLFSTSMYTILRFLYVDAQSSIHNNFNNLPMHLTILNKTGKGWVIITTTSYFSSYQQHSNIIDIPYRYQQKNGVFKFEVAPYTRVEFTVYNVDKPIVNIGGMSLTKRQE